MTQFQYSAQNTAGKAISGNVEAATRDAALSAIVKQGLKPVSIKEAKKAGGLNMSIGGDKVKLVDLVIFTRQLSTMISAGVPLLRSLSTLAEQSESAGLRKILAEVTKDIQSGISLGDALGKHPKVFNDVYVNMVKAGEAGGILDDILKRLAIQQEKSDSMRKKIKGAMTYPAILMIITLGAFIGLMLFVVPQIGGILYDLGGPDAELPALTLAMLKISDFMKSFWYIIIAAVFGASFLIKRYISTPAGKSQFHHIILKVPAIGVIVRKVAVARFARTFSALIGAGVSVLEALRVTGEAVGNTAFKEELVKGAEQVKAGQQLSTSLAKGGLFPGIVPQMLAVGEETGKTDTILIKVADFYEEEVDTAIASISSIIEPIMIVIMGGMVGLIAASVMGPISSLSNNIDG